MIGIGFRKSFAEKLLEGKLLTPDFIEVAPENWMGVGGYWKKQFDKARERYPLYTHGLSLSLGNPEGIDIPFVKEVKKFLDDAGALIYSEHLSFSKCGNVHAYELLPLPFTYESAIHVANQIKTVQDILERRIAIEIVSYYYAVQPEISEIEFVNLVLQMSDCDLLLDVNNIYVNAFNHGYEPYEYIDKLPLERTAYIHMAGHHQVNDKLLIDTHGNAIIDPVYDLFEYAVDKIGRSVPILLERDFNIPDLNDLQHELNTLDKISQKVLSEGKVA